MSLAIVQRELITRFAVIRKVIPGVVRRVVALNAQKSINGREYEGIQIAGPYSHQELAPLLESRANLLVEWADDDALWEAE